MGFGRQVKRLYDLEIDEVSLVDRPANQFGKVAFSKRAEEDVPKYFDVDGAAVDEGDIEHGETVFDDQGNEFVWLQEGTPEWEDLQEQLDDVYDDDDEDAIAEYDDQDEDDEVDERELASVGKRGSRAAVTGGRTSGPVNYRRRGRVNKSLGRSVYSELSKALRQTDRDSAIAKAFEIVDEQAAQIQRLTGVVSKMADDRALEDFAKMAQEYGPLPVSSDRLGLIMKRAADTLPREDVEILDRLFSSVGEQLYSEVGKAGTGESLGVQDQIEALADELVGKSDLTREQAISAIYAENPDAYDMYLDEHPAQVR